MTLLLKKHKGFYDLPLGLVAIGQVFEVEVDQTTPTKTINKIMKLAGCVRTPGGWKKKLPYDQFSCAASSVE